MKSIATIATAIAVLSLSSFAADDKIQTIELGKEFKATSLTMAIFRLQADTKDRSVVLDLYLGQTADPKDKVASVSASDSSAKGVVSTPVQSITIIIPPGWFLVPRQVAGRPTQVEPRTIPITLP